MIKYFYANALDKGKDIELFKEIYKEHLRVWNGFNEKEPKKIGFDDYNNSFINILNHIKNETFDWEKSPVPINIYNYPLNGAHRISACLLYNVNVRCKVINKIERIWDRKFFIHKGLKKEYIDIIDLNINKYYGKYKR